MRHRVQQAPAQLHDNAELRTFGRGFYLKSRLPIIPRYYKTTLSCSSFSCSAFTHTSFGATFFSTQIAAAVPAA